MRHTIYSEKHFLLEIIFLFVAFQQVELYQDAVSWCPFGRPKKDNKNKDKK